VSHTDPNQVAPGRLEDVRELLNTWLIRNDTREVRDDLEEWLSDRDVPGTQWSAVRRFRDEGRAAVEGADQLATVANQWIERYRIVPMVSGEELQLSGDATLAGELASIVVEAIGNGTISRLKACPDCRWVFFDNTRNGSKKWCMMNAAGPGSRGCGNIAKARRHRSRLRSESHVLRPPGV
jgi:hypothetical protein